MSTERANAMELLASTDPLSDAACIGLLHYCEEDDLVDFKEGFDPKSDKSWIDMAIDCAAFANTNGGYVILGIRDKTWDLVGLDDEAAGALADTKKVLEKVNRNLVPPLTRLRTRHVRHDNRTFIALCVPCSTDCTHIFESNLDWSPSPGKTLTRVSKGAIYVRRSASNQVLTSSDFENLLQRRLQRFRSKVLEGVARVVNAPAGHDVVTIIQARDAAGAQSITIGDAPESSGLIGKQVKLASSAIAERLAVYRALTDADPQATVPLHCLYEAYATREAMDIDASVKRWLAFHSAVGGAPLFFWLRELTTAEAREILELAFHAPGHRKGYIVTYSGFYGEHFYEKLRDRMARLVWWSIRAFPGTHALLNVGPSKQVAEDSRRATELARLLTAHRDGGSEHELERLDCALYAPFD